MICRNAIIRTTEHLKVHRWLFLFIVLLGLFRLYLGTSGHLYWPDEKRHIHAVHIVNHVTKGNISKALYHVFDTSARPAHLLLYALPAGVQIALERTGMVSPDNPHLYDVYSVLNVLVSLPIAVLFYHILLLWTRSQWTALFWTVVYSLLCNTNLYIRHLVPYDHSLLLFMCAFYLALRPSPSVRQRDKAAVVCGIISAVAFAAYPGHYVFVLIITAAVCASAARKLRAGIIHLSSAAAVLGVLEFLSHLAGRSYLAISLRLSATLQEEQGTFEEGYVFLLKCMTASEGVIGYTVLFLFFIYILFILPRRSGRLKAVFATVVLGYLVHATFSVVFHQLVFYGRIMHMYVPFVVLGAALAVNHLHGSRIRKSVMGLVSVISLVSFIGFASEFTQLSYPNDLTYNWLSNVPAERVYWASEFGNSGSVSERELGDYDALAVNVQYVFIIPEESIVVAPPRQMVLARAVPHPSSFAAYQFEGCSSEMRQRLVDRQYDMRIYTRRPPKREVQRVFNHTTGPTRHSKRIGVSSTAG
ncbi:MAG: hypothetical protein IID43_00575 [Planctomycetes bacterium]|nr:hypothetical protein [Planctomycetota bacterium]